MKLHIFFLVLTGLFTSFQTKAMDYFSPESQALFLAIEKEKGTIFFQKSSSPKIIFKCSKSAPTAKKTKDCPHCTRKFSNNSHLTRHIQTAHIKTRFKCDRPNCRKSFPRRDTLKEHIFQVHDSRERFKCTLDGCTGKGDFGCRSTLVKHLRKKHNLHMIPGTPEYAQLTQCTFHIPDETLESSSSGE